MSLLEELREFLGSGERRVAILGVGSPMRGDDAVGLEVVKLLKGRGLEGVLVLETQTVPESFTGVLREFKPTHVLLIDAAHLDAEPGEARFIPTQLICDVCISTHKLPLTVLSDFLEGTLGSGVRLVGIQPRSVYFGEEMTPELQDAAARVADTLCMALAR